MNECMTQEDAMNMSDEQAVQILKPFRNAMIDPNGCPISDAVFALDKAIVALSKKMPTVEPERRKGKWIAKSTNGEMFDVCSVCGYVEWDEPHNYCPNCGADMRTSE